MTTGLILAPSASRTKKRPYRSSNTGKRPRTEQIRLKECARPMSERVADGLAAKNGEQKRRLKGLCIFQGSTWWTGGRPRHGATLASSMIRGANAAKGPSGGGFSSHGRSFARKLTRPTRGRPQSKGFQSIWPSASILRRCGSSTINIVARDPALWFLP